MRALALLISLLLFSPALAKDLSVPSQLAGLKLVQALKGEKGIKAISRLHGGKRFPIKDGLLAIYRGGASEARLWVGEAGDENEAAALLNRMVSGIGRGGTPFTSPQKLEFGNKIIYSSQGQGKNHYFYSIRNKVIWLEVEPGLAVGALHQVLKLFK